MNPVTGIHHVTAIASDAQRNVEFYTGVLGLRLVKRTVNFDDPTAYHLYYGDATGAPGSIVTFFYWPGFAARGQVGSGQMTGLTFSVPAGALEFWQDRLGRRGLAVKRHERFGEDVLSFKDPDGIPSELVATANDPRVGWTGGDVPAEHAVRGLHTAELSVRNAEATARLLTDTMGYRRVRSDGPRTRYAAGAATHGSYVDVIGDATLPSGRGGSGTIHHIAWRVADDTAELGMQRRLQEAGLHVSPVRDRHYFRSIYYRERNGILFEIATDIPGFAVDEPVESLGASLKLPAQFEPHRGDIEASLPSLELAGK